MVRVKYDEFFVRTISKIKDNTVRGIIKKKIKKIVEDPEIGKPMRNVRKGTREVYVDSFRLSYRYLVNEDLLEFLDFYHKGDQ